MHAGIIEQVGTPKDLYNRPKTVFAADFIGGANILWIEVECNGNHFIGTLPDGRAISLHGRGDLIEGFRPFMVRQEAIRFAPKGDDVVRLEGIIESQHFSGSVIKSIIRFGNTQISALTPAKDTPERSGSIIFGMLYNDLIGINN
jgi:ABC-type Fe3+/spermidine/putrescine transport system ATPase subunit